MNYLFKPYLYEFNRVPLIPNDALRFTLSNGEIETKNGKIILTLDFQGDEEGVREYIYQRMKNWEGNFSCIKKPTVCVKEC